MEKTPQWLTVKETAEKVGMTTQAIYKRIKNNELQTKKENGLTYVIFEEVANSLQPVAKNDTTEIVELLKSQIESNQQTINLLQMQLQEKDEQIKQLHVIMARSQDNFKHTQLALESAEKQLQTSWWNRIFGRKRGKPLRAHP